MSDRTKTHFTNRLSVHITPAMSDRLDQLAIQRDMPKAEIAREALRSYLDDQEDVISSRKHFTKRFQKRIDYLETMIAIVYMMHVYTFQKTKNRDVDTSTMINDVIEIAVTQEDQFHHMIEFYKQQKPSK